MQAFTFLHCADLHLGAPFQGLADLPPELADRLREAPMQALDRIVAAAIERRVAGVIMAGDIFDAADRNLRAQIQLRDRLRQLHEADIPTLIAAGNHDPLGAAVSSISYPSSVHFFDTELEAVPLMRGNEVVAHVYGVSYGAPEVRDNLVEKFPARPEGPFSIAVLHTNVGDRPGHGAYSPCSLADLESRAFDYWALGHVHKRETPSSSTPIVHYPGNTQGLHRKEVGPRGATLVEVSDQGVKLTPVWTDRVRWHRARTSIEKLETIDEIIDAFAGITAEVAGEAPDRLHIVSWSLGGSGRLHQELRQPNVAADLIEALRAEHAPAPQPGAVWLQRIELATRPQRDLEEMRKQQDLLGDLLRLAEAARAHPPAPRNTGIGGKLEIEAANEVTTAIEDALSKLLDEPRLAPMLGYDPWSAIDWPRLVRRAEVLALDGLLPDEDTES